jgi:hypothetical protein
VNAALYEYSSPQIHLVYLLATVSAAGLQAIPNEVPSHSLKCRVPNSRKGCGSFVKLPAFISLSFEICALLGYYRALADICVPTFRDRLSVPPSRVKKFKKKVFVFLDH